MPAFVNQYGIVLAIAAGLASALLYLSVLSGGLGAVLLGYLAPLPLFGIGLLAGAAAAGVAGLVAAVVAAVFAGSALAGLLYAASCALPAVYLCRKVLLSRDDGNGGIEWYPPGPALLGLTGLGLIGFTVAVVWGATEEGGLKGVLTGLLRAMLGQFAVSIGGDATGNAAVDVEPALWMAPAMPGLIVISWMMMTVINGLLAQGLLTRLGRNSRPAMPMRALALPVWVPVVFGVATASALLLPDPLGFWGLNAALILGVPLGFAGLVIVHTIAGIKPGRKPLLVAFYGFLFVFGWPIALLVGLGVIETWTGLSRRLTAGGKGQED